MESITLMGVVLHPHTFPLIFGLPAVLIFGAVAGGLYEIFNKDDKRREHD